MALSVNIGEYWRDKQTHRVVKIYDTSIWFDTLAIQLKYTDKENTTHIMTETQFLRLYERIDNEKN